ncbi:MAG: 50S ribosomal protein L19 [Buchnera aphidicola (Chaetogeoica yunlongensis)]
MNDFQSSKKKIKKIFPNFKSGDTITVNIWVIEGTKKRIQVFEGIVIAIKNRGVNSSFCVRKISHGEGIERTFPKYSPIIEKIIIKKFGDVRKSKLYYLRNRIGKSAKIKELLHKKILN